PPAKPAEPSPLTPEALVQNCTLDYATLAGSGILAPWSGTQRVVEEFRIIKRNIMARGQISQERTLSEGVARTVMLPSSKPREGKTFASISLALAFAAEKELETVLIDADPQRGEVA